MKEGRSLWITAILAGLVVMAAAVVKQEPRVAERPIREVEVHAEDHLSHKRFPARLWNDPISAARAHTDHLKQAPGGNEGTEDSFQRRAWASWIEAGEQVSESAGLTHPRAVPAARELALLLYIESTRQEADMLLLLSFVAAPLLYPYPLQFWDSIGFYEPFDYTTTLILNFWPSEYEYNRRLAAYLTATYSEWKKQGDQSREKAVRRDQTSRPDDNGSQPKNPYPGQISHFNHAVQIAAQWLSARLDEISSTTPQGESKEADCSDLELLEAVRSLLGQELQNHSNPDQGDNIQNSFYSLDEGAKPTSNVITGPEIERLIGELKNELGAIGAVSGKENQSTAAEPQESRSLGLERNPSHVALLPIIVSGEASSEAVESRLRTRFALQTAMRDAGYIPASEKYLDFLFVPISMGTTSSKAVSQPGTILKTKEGSEDGTLFKPLPYETFFLKEVASDSLVSSTSHSIGSQSKAETSSNSSTPRRVIAIWISRDVIGESSQAAGNLLTLINQCKAVLEPQPQTQAVISTGGSDTLARFLAMPLAIKSASTENGLQEVNTQSHSSPTEAKEVDVPELNLYFPASSARAADIWRRADFLNQLTAESINRGHFDKRAGASSVQTRKAVIEVGAKQAEETPGSDVPDKEAEKPPNQSSGLLAQAEIIRCSPNDAEVFSRLTQELRMRIPSLGRSRGKLPEILLISESDTFYSRSVLSTFREAYAEAMELDVLGAERAVGNLTFLRGADGHLPFEGRQSSHPDEHQSTPTSIAGILATIMLKDSDTHQELLGRRQLDYAERMLSNLSTYHGTLPQEERIKAVGVIGSDIYDKIQLLQLAKRNFPDAILFTEGLDYRFLHVEPQSSLRNLLVVGPALSVPEGKNHLLSGFREFRDSQQVGLYLSVRHALNSTEGEVLASRTAVEAFEIGKTRFVRLPRIGPSMAKLSMKFKSFPTRTASINEKVSIKENPAPVGVQPLTRPPFPLFFLIGLTLVCILRLVPDLIITFNKTVHGDPHALESHHEEYLRPQRLQIGEKLSELVPLGPLLILLGLLGVCAIVFTLKPFFQSVEEPVELLEGVSVWPGSLLNLIAIILGLLLFVRSTNLAVDLRNVGVRTDKGRSTPEERLLMLALHIGVCFLCSLLFMGLLRVIPQFVGQQQSFFTPARGQGAWVLTSALSALSLATFFLVLFSSILLHAQGISRLKRLAKCPELFFKSKTSGLPLLTSSQELGTEQPNKLFPWPFSRRKQKDSQNNAKAGKKGVKEVTPRVKTEPATSEVKVVRQSFLDQLADTTNAAANTILFPFGILVLHLFSRHPIFDAWNQPLILWVMTGLALAGLLMSSMALISQARMFRNRLLSYEHPSSSFSLNTGIYGGFTQIPAIQALLLLGFGVGATHFESLLHLFGI